MAGCPLSILPTSRREDSRVSSSCVTALAEPNGDANYGGNAAAAQQPRRRRHMCSTTGYYSDSSGRAMVRLTLRLGLNGEAEVDRIVRSGCLVPPPSTSDCGNDQLEDEQTKQPQLTSKKATGTTAALRFECSISTDGGREELSVEAISVVATHVDRSDLEDCAILFEVELSVRSLCPSNDGQGEDRDVGGGDGSGRRNEHIGSHGGVGTAGCGVLEIRAVLSEQMPQLAGATIEGRPPASTAPSLPLGLLALDIGSGTTMVPSASKGSFRHYSTLQTRTEAALLRLHLVEPLTLAIREVGGARAASGATLVSVTVSHSNQHDEDIIVTNLALHPGHSRPWDATLHNSPLAYTSPSGSRLRNTSILAGPDSVLDMSTSVRWGYAPGADPSLPFLLRPHESVATVLQIDASENLKSRGYVSPVAVTAVVGDARDGDLIKLTNRNCKAGKTDNDMMKAMEEPTPTPVMVSADARWTTARLAVDPTDAFRVDLSLEGSESTRKVGAPIMVTLRVMNLSSETRDLMLLMAKDEESSRDKDGGALGFGGYRRNYKKAPYISSNTSVNTFGGSSVVASGGSIPLGRKHSSPPGLPPSHHGVNTAVVSEVNGYTFGVWGLSGDDDGTARHNRDHELLAVDAALLLGEVKGQHTIEAELRFVPLREGTLDVPNLKLYDKFGGQWYNCVHLLKIVASAKS